MAKSPKRPKGETFEVPYSDHEDNFCGKPKSEALARWDQAHVAGKVQHVKRDTKRRMFTIELRA